MDRIIHLLANSQTFFINGARVAILIVMVWIGGLKAFQYEADGIVPFVANSPLMSFFITMMLPNINSTGIQKEKLFLKMWSGISRMGPMFFPMV